MTQTKGPFREHASEVFDSRTIIAPFAGLLLLMLLASLDQTIVATALPTVVGDLGSLKDVSWVVTAYLLGSVASTPVWGKIGDLYGRKRMLLVSVGVFLIGSALSGFAINVGELIGLRGLQGIGAGGMMALAMASVGDLVPPRQRGRYQGYIQATFAVATVLGPLAGGSLVDHASWRWIFYINLPIGAVALALLALRLPGDAERRKARVDYVGAALMVGSVVSLLLVVTWGGQSHAWSSAVILGLGATAVVLGAVFIFWERRVEEPILSVKMLRNPVVTVVSATLFFASLSFFAGIVYVPLFLQVVKGLTATNSGLMLVAMMAGVLLSTTISGRLISRTGRYKIFPVVGLALTTIAMWLLSTMTADTPWGVVAGFLLVLGTGFGLVTQVLVLAVQNAISRQDMGTGTATTSFFRALGGSVGVAVFGAILNGRMTDSLQASSSVGATGPQQLLASPESINGLAEPVRLAVVHSVQQGLHGVFLAAIPLAAIGFVTVLFLLEVPLKSGTPGK